MIAFPQYFAVYHNRTKSFQLFESRNITHISSNHYNIYGISNFIEPIPVTTQFRTSIHYINNNNDFGEYIVKIANMSEDQLRYDERKFQSSPFKLILNITDISSHSVPVLLFQYNSWLPPQNINLTSNISVADEELYLKYNTPNTITNTFIDHYNEEDNNMIEENEDNETVVNNVVRHLSFDDISLVRPHVSSITPLFLPSHIGKMIITNARLGNECCPILSQPLKECHTLSVTSCFHIFDRNSLQTWRIINNNCPECRCVIVNVVDE